MATYTVRQRWNFWVTLATFALLSSTLWITGSSAAAYPKKLLLRDDDPDTTGPIIVPNPVCTTTVSSAYPAAPTDTAGETPVEGLTYFSISDKCYFDSSIIDTSKYKTKADFIKQAIKDATTLAKSIDGWPLHYGAEASDLYFGPTAKDKYSDEIKANIDAVANWDNPQGGFDTYIVIGCSQDASGNNIGMGDCNKKIGNDNRKIGGYANNTYSWFWNKSFAWMCNVFFNADSIDDIAHNGEKDDPENLDLRYYQTAGGMLLHELMHTLEITGTGKDKREHIADLTFNNGRRIYGPVDVAKAARVYGAFETRLNADSFTQFVSAIYWQKRKGARHPPKPSIESSVGTLEEWQEALSDSSGNYFDTCLEPPKDFNCNCGEGGCSADSLPCCASGSCKCNCNESGCGRTDPACCASGTCKF